MPDPTAAERAREVIANALPPDVPRFMVANLAVDALQNRPSLLAALAVEAGGMERDGAEAITAERRRQTEVEGWTPEHDAQHTEGELARAAMCYAHAADGVRICADAPDPVLAYFGRGIGGGPDLPYLVRWPWERSWWKPTNDPIRNLIKAGALIAAEIDRLRRVEGERGE